MEPPFCRPCNAKHYGTCMEYIASDLERIGEEDRKRRKRLGIPPVTSVTPEPVTQVTRYDGNVTQVTQHCPGCRCKKYSSKAEKQKAYRKRKSEVPSFSP